MSKIECHVGKLRKVNLSGTVEEQCETLVKSECMKIVEHPETYREFLEDELYEKYAIVNDTIYEILEKNEIDDEYIAFAEKNTDDTFWFLIRYYNGGCCFSEAIEDALENVQK